MEVCDAESTNNKNSIRFSLLARRNHYY